MAGPQGSKYYNIFLEYEVWLTGKGTDVRTGDQLTRLLLEIDKSGSIRSAADKLGISYRKAWGDLQEAEKFLGLSLIDTQRGGRSGGMTRLTEDGHELVKAFAELHEEFDQAIYRITRKFFHQLNRVSDSSD